MKDFPKNKTVAGLCGESACNPDDAIRSCSPLACLDNQAMRTLVTGDREVQTRRLVVGKYATRRDISCFSYKRALCKLTPKFFPSCFCLLVIFNHYARVGVIPVLLVKSYQFIVVAGRIMHTNFK